MNDKKNTGKDMVKNMEKNAEKGTGEKVMTDRDAGKTAARDAWHDMCDIFLPLGAAREGDAWVCVNGRSFQIPRGKHWQVPRAIAEVLERSERKREAANEAAREMK